MITKQEVIKGTKQELVEFFINTAHINLESTDVNTLTSKTNIENQIDNVNSVRGNGLGRVFYLIKKESDGTEEINLELMSSLIEVIDKERIKRLIEETEALVN